MSSVHALLPHPSALGSAVTAISVAMQGRPSNTLELRYRVTGPQAVACLQGAPGGGRTDGLWAHTCCELFVGIAGESGYREFNFSPRGAWAAYDFSDYRAGMRPAVLSAEPALQLLQEEYAWTLAVSFTGADLPLAGGAVMAGEAGGSGEAGGAGARLLGLSVVIEPPAGGLAYWALRHPSAKPDFHHRDAFVIEWR